MSLLVFFRLRFTSVAFFLLPPVYPAYADRQVTWQSLAGELNCSGASSLESNQASPTYQSGCCALQPERQFELNVLVYTRDLNL